MCKTFFEKFLNFASKITPFCAKFANNSSNLALQTLFIRLRDLIAVTLQSFLPMANGL